MNEQLQAKLIEILSAIQAGAKATGDFAMAQLPDIAQSYVMYGRAYLTIMVMLPLMFLIIAWPNYIRKVYPKFKDTPDAVVLVGMAMVILSTVSLGTFAACISEFLMVWFAPKVWLIKEIANLIR